MRLSDPAGFLDAGSQRRVDPGLPSHALGLEMIKYVSVNP